MDFARTFNRTITYQTGACNTLASRYDASLYAPGRTAMSATPLITAAIDAAALFQRLSLVEPVLVLAANRRLVLTLNQAYGDWQRQRGTQVWQTPTILTFEHWLDSASDNLIHAGQWPADSLPDAVLEPAEELPLWQQLIDSDEAALIGSQQSLLSTAALAAEAAEAHALLCEYPAAIPDAFATEEFRHLQNWRRMMRAHCQPRQWLTAPEWRREQVRRLAAALSGPCSGNAELQLGPALVAAEPQHSDARNGILQPVNLPRVGLLKPKAIVLAGFDDLRPWLRTVLTAAHANDCALFQLQERAQGSGSQTLYRPVDAAQENTLIARWCRQQLQANPAAALAVVMPSLAARKVALLRSLRSELEPANSFRFDDSPSADINLSLGEVLAELPLIAIALRALRLFTAGNSQAWPLSDLSPLLLSCHIGEQQERDGRARFDAWLREQGSPALRADTVLKLLADRAGVSQLAERWSKALDTAHSWRQKKLPLRDWSERLRELLDQLGWPGSRGLNSAEFQAREAFLKMLAALARSRVPEGAVTLAKAVSTLNQRCRQELFQPQQPGTARVQVTGLLEAAAIKADAIWIGDGRDDLLPAPIQPNPLLPIAWQRSHNLPRSSHAREQQFAAQLVQRLITTAADIVWSCPQFDGDRELRLSPFLQALTVSEIPPLLQQPFAAIQTTPRQALECLRDDAAPALHSDEPIRPDSNLLAVQAMQPQAAFVQYRLHARPVQDLPQARQPGERGTLVHRALATLWQGLQTSSALAQLDEAELTQRCDAAASGALSAQARQLQQTLPPRWQQLEREALTMVLREWLKFEQQRPCAFSVQQIEQAAELELAGLPLSLRLDRVDLLADGSAVVMDYKTGSQWQTPPWQAERPHDVQLMLYSLATDAPLAAVVAARVRAGEPHFKGLCASTEALPLKPDKLLAETTLDDLRAIWRERLNALAGEFVSGHAENICYHPNAANTVAAPFLRLTAMTEEEPE